MFSLEIKVEGFLSVDGIGKKAYRKGTTINWTVELGSLTLEELKLSLANEIN